MPSRSSKAARPRDEPKASNLSTGVRETLRRPLRIFPFDPMFDRFHDPIVSKVPYEAVTEGPAGRLVEVVDLDGSTRQVRPPLDLNSHEVLIGRGLTPSERDLRSHQQMVYAVSMRVLETFERSLGRPFDWLDRLRLLPHAFDDNNAYFDPSPFAIMFGYFTADEADPARGNLAGQRIFTCLSYDIVAHQVCHPVMSRLRPSDRFDEDAEDDTPAFHEGLADLIAILVRFSEPDVVARIIRTCGAGLEGTPLLRIAMQFGTTLNNSESLRSYPGKPDPEQYNNEREPHSRGGLLASAILEAFLAANDKQMADLLRLNGGQPDAGNVHPDLVARLADQASILASRAARSTIAALDYLPPVGLAFYDVLRAVLATDMMLFGKANQGYRSLLIQAFHRRGLIPRDPGSLAVEALMLGQTGGELDQPVPHAGDALLAHRDRQWVSPPVHRAAIARRPGPRRPWKIRASKPRVGAAISKCSPVRISRRSGSTDDRPVRAPDCTAPTNSTAPATSSRARSSRSSSTMATSPCAGVTLVCDSDGRIQYVVGKKADHQPSDRRAPRLTAEQQLLAQSLKNFWTGPSASAEGLSQLPDRVIDRRSWRRPLRVIPFDPMVDRAGRSVVADVMYEKIEPGPAGRLVEIIDYDPVHKCWYEPIDLDDPAVMLDSGLDVAETDPRFHQQMVYAVVMRVLETFERALGRPFRWRGKRRLRVYPHAFVGENAYFDENLFALLFGYFTASEDDPGPNLPGQVVFTALSHDIIAHETTHAVLHRLRKHYSMPTNPDVLAFHEGFADIVAILQHFNYREVVAQHIAATRADLTDRTLSETSPLLSLASQFGYAVGDAGPLRTALMNADKSSYVNAEEEHARGAVLVAAVMDGFLRSYHEGIEDILRIATAGTGVLQPGALHPDLVERVASAACFTAERITQICIRAFDYLPPVDITFSDYLRALVTADIDLFPDDTIHLRANLIEGFRARGIYPAGVVSLADRSLRIEPVDPQAFSPLPAVRERLLDAAREFDRRRRSNAEVLSEEDVDDEAGDPVVGGSEWARP